MLRLYKASRAISHVLGAAVALLMLLVSPSVYAHGSNDHREDKPYRAIQVAQIASDSAALVTIQSATTALDINADLHCEYCLSVHQSQPDSSPKLLDDCGDGCSSSAIVFSYSQIPITSAFATIAIGAQTLSSKTPSRIERPPRRPV